MPTICETCNETGETNEQPSRNCNNVSECVAYGMIFTSSKPKHPFFSSNVDIMKNNSKNVWRFKYEINL